MSDLAAALVAAVLGMVGGAVAPAVIRRLPEPELAAAPEPDAEGTDGTEGSRLSIKAVHQGEKTSYAELADGSRVAVVCALLGALAGAVLGYRLGWQADLAVPLVAVPAGTWLGYVDARTTFLPTVLIWPTLLVVALTAVVVAASAGQWPDAERAAIGALVYGGLFYLLWLITPGFGFGDVRLAFLLGAVLGFLGFYELATGVIGGLVLGGVGGALLALLKVIDARRNPFGPHMLLGALVAAGFGPHLAQLLGY